MWYVFEFLWYKLEKFVLKSYCIIPQRYKWETFIRIADRLNKSSSNQSVHYFYVKFLWFATKIWRKSTTFFWYMQIFFLLKCCFISFFLWFCTFFWHKTAKTVPLHAIKFLKLCKLFRNFHLSKHPYFLQNFGYLNYQKFEGVSKIAWHPLFCYSEVIDTPPCHWFSMSPQWAECNRRFTSM